MIEPPLPADPLSCPEDADDELKLEALGPLTPYERALLRRILHHIDDCLPELLALAQEMALSPTGALDPDGARIYRALQAFAASRGWG